jgi:6-pyruvoyltetrahydropterin/6-carboxytetrahydropterin synthase
MTTTITRIYAFSAAHTLPSHPGKCKQMHGHNYRLEVTVVKNPWFHELDEWVQPILDRYDHSYLNDLLIAEPTVEHLAEAIFGSGDGVFLRVRLWENDCSFAEVQ